MEIEKIVSVFPNEFSVKITLEDGYEHILGPFSKDEDAIDAVEAFEKREFGEKLDNNNNNKLSPFDFLNSFYKGINPFDNMDLGEMELNSKGYSQFMINRAMSMSEDNVFIANELNRLKVNNLAHAAYCANSCKKPSRYSKWIKESKKSKKELEQIEDIIKECNVSRKRAEEYLEVLNLINKST